MLEFFNDQTVRTVLIGAVILGASTGALGVFAVLRRQSLLGDLLAHAALPGIVVGYFVTGTHTLPVLLLGALGSGVLAALFALLVARVPGVQREAAIGATLVLSFALGLVLLSVAERMPGTQSGALQTFLFGQAAATIEREVFMLAGAAAVLMVLLTVVFRAGTSVAFDPDFARAQGVQVFATEVWLTALLAVAIVIGLQMVGVVLMAALVIAPAVAAKQWAKNVVHMTVLAAGIGGVSGAVGAGISALQPGLATGPLIVLSATLIAVLAIFTRRHA